MFRFLPGIILSQATAVILTVAFLNSQEIPWIWMLYAALALIISILVAFWFSSIATHLKKDALAKAKERLSQERERILLSTAEEKSRVFAQTHRQIMKETGRAHAKANFKSGAIITGVVGLGVGLFSLQMVTGLIALLATGGAATAGYIVYRKRGNLLPRFKDSQVKVIEHDRAAGDESQKIIDLDPSINNSKSDFKSTK
ncbi:hypothetical protein [Candidatus Nitrosacidococcus tergens]|uniref:Transmembrane protein n=1 Tax=Candidatus Nitrosacidococcus tergens TaxID=553981 RepID=A0A7G1Q906_9GAMM|nr:hypothetical protein [Candidatus Nitrosacidococcus tergens]CAB1275637.1 membrane protein of unknown function [Candidatus Nitrosacidococcus tergens]